MASESAARIARWKARLASLPSIALPTDYPRPQNNQLVQALTSSSLSTKANTALVRLAIHQDHERNIDDRGADDDEEDDEDGQGGADQSPTPFHLLLAAFAVLLHRYTGDTDLVIATSSPTSGEPLILRIPIEPGDPFWQIVRRVQSVEADAAADAVPYLDIVRAIEEERIQREGAPSEGAPPSAPIFRVRFFDETGGLVSNFRQSTSLTTDLTVFVTRPGVDVGIGAEVSAMSSSTGSSATVTGNSASMTASTSSAAFRTPVVPSISLHLSYNSLLFSSARMSTLLSHLSHVLVVAAANPAAAVGSIGIRTPAEATVLPDPRKDLEWCGFRGSITSIFERNAKAHPDRRCLVESQAAPAGAFDLPPPASSVREVTYGQLDRASNVVAHHLLQGGVQREEVVTVYAHRGVDLVVAVLGTLKAGATFSVIDPAYPPSRQNIYLQVAKPRALVVLAKAGVLHPTVRQCIQSELEIRVEVPALELAADGTIKGGAANEGGTDVLDAAQKLAGQSTGVVLGPDSVGTLSFTSGSTGIPKGVRGRHFSLTHFFPWMGERFGLSDKEHFTMLSGIAHDPIQRDIFTPLFFGAELHIPTAEDIGTPGRLAEWMAASKATVTHLTPAMGQLLSAQAVAQIPSLRNAFFVGDVLTKRDCTRLQALASNVRIINMYGTTETQRAVSYFAIPPVSENSTFLQTQKDIMPAGQGMINVQLLVVNRHERTTTCAVGEVGEIYVRSGGLAEGYLGPPSVSAEKFMPNFLAPDLQWPDTVKGTPEGQYWHGVRDRMYRTGDLGRYLPDGTVECTGRADDQVKIRGFRIELGEIDTHLSQHPHVRENVTLVRRDKDEEKVLVSYFVPGPGAAALEEASSAEEDADAPQSRDAGLVRGMRRNRGLIKDIRDYLKKKLPAYSVPTLFVPLGRMPLNPNGKIDKPALPFPDTAVGAAAASSGGSKAKGNSSSISASGASSASSANLTPTETTLVSLWSKLLTSAPQPLPLDESFFDLGGHSILATRLVFEMRKAFVAPIPLGLVFDAPTISALAREVDRMRDNDLNLGNVQSTSADQQAAAASIPATATVEEDYAGDLKVLSDLVPSSYPSSSASTSARTVLLTGATGFLGAFVLRDLLANRSPQVKQVIAHVRAKDAAIGLERLREGGKARGAWDEKWVQDGRLQVVVGDLAAKERLGLDTQTWSRLEEEVDDIIHNGALVHWVYPYSKLRAANVGSTICAMNLAAKARAKTFTFVSSTSALDTEHYVNLSDEVMARRTGNKEDPTPLLGVSETDDLEGSAKGLGTGYGQSKWVAERLVMLGAFRGLRASIVRPGYVVGDSVSAVTNTDDFLWRLVKGSTQLGRFPDMHNVVNMVPVDHVARVTALAALALGKGKEGIPTADRQLPSTHAVVYHVTGHPPIRFNDLLEALEIHGWDVERTDYVQWRALLEEHVLKSGADSDNALFPLLHFVLDDLPTSTKAPELDDRHTSMLLTQAQEDEAHNVIRGVDASLVAVYLAWLVQVGFLDQPTKKGAKELPKVEMGGLKAIGRGSAN